MLARRHNIKLKEKKERESKTQAQKTNTKKKQKKEKRLSSLQNLTMYTMYTITLQVKLICFATHETHSATHSQYKKAFIYINIVKNTFKRICAVFVSSFLFLIYVMCVIVICYINSSFSDSYTMISYHFLMFFDAFQYVFHL